MTHFPSFTPLISCSLCIKSVYRRRQREGWGEKVVITHTPLLLGVFVYSISVLEFAARVLFGLHLRRALAPALPPSVSHERVWFSPQQPIRHLEGGGDAWVAL